MSLILKMFILSPTNYVRFFPKTTYCSYLITSGFAPQILPSVDYWSFLPQYAHSLPYRSSQVLPPKFSLTVHNLLLRFYLKVLILNIIISSFPPKIPLLSTTDSLQENSRKGSWQDED